MLAEYYRPKRGGIGPLRSWLDRNWRVDPEKIASSQLHRIIVELDFPIIYTTNYDRNPETAFDVLHKPYAKNSFWKRRNSGSIRLPNSVPPVSRRSQKRRNSFDETIF